MNITSSSLGFIKVLDSGGNTLRYIDLIRKTEPTGSVVDPYLFLYKNISNARGTDFSLPLQGLNHSKALDNVIRPLIPTEDKSTALLYSEVLLPQYSDEQDLETKEIGTYIGVQTEDDSYINIYFTIYPGEVYAEIYKPSTDLSDGYGILDSSNTYLVYTTKNLTPTDKLRSIVLGVNLSTEEWNWTKTVADNSVRPIHWVNKSTEEDLNKLPTQIKEDSVVYNEDDLSLYVGTNRLFTNPIKTRQ